MILVCKNIKDNIGQQSIPLNKRKLSICPCNNQSNMFGFTGFSTPQSSQHVNHVTSTLACRPLSSLSKTSKPLARKKLNIELSWVVPRWGLGWGTSWMKFATDQLWHVGHVDRLKTLGSESACDLAAAAAVETSSWVETCALRGTCGDSGKLRWAWATSQKCECGVGFDGLVPKKSSIILKSIFPS